MKGANLRFIVFLLGVSLGDIPSLYAQEDQSIVAELMGRIEALEEEQRHLRGQLEETRHDLTLLQQKTDTLSSDVDFRLKGTEKELSTPKIGLSSSEEDEFSSSPAQSVEDEYEKARSLLEQGDYEAAEKAFSRIVSNHPKDKAAGAAQYWLGVTYFVRGEYEKAAASFAKGYKNYPKSPKAPDTLLKLAKSLGLLDRKADACTTLDQLLAEHPKSSLAKEVSSERSKLGCK